MRSSRTPIPIYSRPVKALFVTMLLCFMTAFARSTAASADSMSTPTPSATSISASEVDLAWPAIDGATSYTIQRSDDQLNWYLIASNQMHTTYQDTIANNPIPPKPGSIYFYEVKAVGAHSESAWSSPTSAVTSVTGIVAAAHFWRNRIFWSPSPVNGQYTVYRSDRMNGLFLPLTKKPVATNIFDDTSAVGGHTYFYQVTVSLQSPQLTSAPSATVTAKTYAGISLGSSTPFTSAGPYEADTLLMSAKPGSTSSSIYGTSSPMLYQTWREARPFESIDISTPIPNGFYTLTLRFAELGAAHLGQRLFDVTLNGQIVAHKFDIQRTSGSPNTASDLRLTAKITGGNLSISLTPASGTVYGPALNAIVVYPSQYRF